METHWIATAFTTVNALRVLFYLPQICAVARSVSGARDIALSTWFFWTLTNGLGTAYGLVVAGDAWLALSFALSAACCLAVVALTVAKRLRFVPRPAAPDLARPVR